MRLLVQGGLPIAGGIIGYGGELSWLKPTRPGDTLSVVSEIQSGNSATTALGPRFRGGDQGSHSTTICPYIHGCGVQM